MDTELIEKKLADSDDDVPSGYYRIDGKLYEFVGSEMYSESERSDNGRKSRAFGRRRGSAKSSLGSQAQSETDEEEN